MTCDCHACQAERRIHERLDRLEQQREWLTPEQVAAELGIAESTAYSKIRRHVIPSHQLDGRTYVSRSELFATIAAAPSPRQVA